MSLKDLPPKFRNKAELKQLIFWNGFNIYLHKKDEDNFAFIWYHYNLKEYVITCEKKIAKSSLVNPLIDWVDKAKWTKLNGFAYLPRLWMSKQDTNLVWYFFSSSHSCVRMNIHMLVMTLCRKFFPTMTSYALVTVCMISNAR